jgi:hypothetical protein
LFITAAIERARTQNNLGIALAAIEGRESGTAKLEGAVVAYREALKEQTRERVLLSWAISFGNEDCRRTAFISAVGRSRHKPERDGILV